MARSAHGIDYEAELAAIRATYVCATPRQRLHIIRQRLNDHHVGPNCLVTAVSAVEALARTLALHAACETKIEISTNYLKYRNRKPERLIRGSSGRPASDACQWALAYGLRPPLSHNVT